MATVTKPIALDESLNTTESPSRNIADVLAEELSGITTALTSAGSSTLHLFKKLWENPSPTSAFASQNITLSSDDYDFLLYVFKNDSSGSIVISSIGQKGTNALLTYTITTSSGAQTARRQVNYISAKGVNVDNGYVSSTGTTAHTQTNTACVPIYIYGFKKSVDINAIVSSVSTSADKCMLDDGVTSAEEAINSLATTTNTLTLDVDISARDSSNPYYAPTDGYIWLRNTSGQTGRLVAYDSNVVIGGVQGDFSLYVKKGCKITANGTSYYMFFRAFS